MSYEKDEIAILNKALDLAIPKEEEVDECPFSIHNYDPEARPEYCDEDGDLNCYYWDNNTREQRHGGRQACWKRYYITKARQILNKEEK